MLISLDASSPMPIYGQLVEQIKWLVSSGQLKPGEQLATVRQLAVELRINPNTVARAYGELEREGVIATQQGRGTFVLAEPRVTPGSDREERLERLVRAAVVEASAFGYTPEEVARAILKTTAQEENGNA
jgi:GntR family transcriptional regulator